MKLKFSFLLFSGLLILALFTAPCFLSGQDYLIENFDLADGMPHTEVYDLLQSDDKIIWMATEGGVASFDGRAFTNYTSSQGLLSNDVKSITEGSCGDIWVVFNVEGMSLIRDGEVVDLPADLDTLTRNSLVRQTYTSNSDLLYIFCGKGVYCWNGEKLVTIISKSQMVDNFFSCTAGIVVADSLVFWGNGSQKLYKYDMIQDCLQEINPSKKEHKVGWIRDIKLDKNNKVWFCSHQLQYIENDMAFQVDFTPNNRYMKIEFIGQDSIVASLEGSGFFVADMNKKQIFLENIKASLPSLFIYDAIVDHEGNFWLASYGTGLLRFRDQSFQSLSDRNGLASKSVQDVIVFNDKTYVGTGKGLIVIDKGSIIDTLFKNTGINSLAIDEEESLYVQTSDAIFSTNKSAGFQQVISGQRLQIYTYRNYIISHDGSNLLFFDKESNEIVERFSQSNIREFIKVGGYLIARSLNKIRLYDGIIERTELLSELKNFNEFRTMDALGKDSLLIKSATDLHLLVFTEDHVETITLPLQDLPLIKTVNSILAQNSFLWMGGGKVLYKLNLEKFLVQREIQYSEIRLPKKYLKSFLADDGLVFDDMGRINGFSLTGLWMFEEEAFRPNSKPPIIKLKGLELQSEVKDKNFLRNDTTYKFDYKENDIEFALQAISYDYASQIEYKYRLHGLSNASNWSQPQQIDRIHFEFLPDGKYVFEFTARKDNGVWNQDPFKYSFTIARPFWKRINFWLGILTLLTFISFIAYRYSKNQVYRRQKKFTEKVLEVHDKERMRLSQEIHDSLGQKMMLVARSANQQENVELKLLADEALNELRTISKGLYPSVLKDLGLSTSLEDMITSIDEITEVLIDYEIDQLDQFLTKDQALHIFRIVQESLNNIVKHSYAKVASLSLKLVDNELIILISDNGRGFDNQKYTFDTVGLQSIKQRCDFIGAKLNVRSNVGQGSSLRIVMPLS